MCVYLHVKCEVASKILMSFSLRVGGEGGGGGGVILPSPPPQNEPLKSPSRLGLILEAQFGGDLLVVWVVHQAI